MEEKILSLVKLKEGESGQIRSIEGGSNLVSRLASLGLVVGVTVRVLRNSGRGMVILQIGANRIALGHGETAGIVIERVQPQTVAEETPGEVRDIRVALVGQPNVGKSTVFNILTGLSQHVGNWPGKTVEKKEGVHLGRDTRITIVDLPGTYSLSSQSEEERVAREYMMSDEVNVIVVLANASALERGLYILSEVLLIGKPTIFALNMFDLSQDVGIGIDCAALEEELGIPVVPMVATKNQGIRELVTKISAIMRDGYFFHPSLPRIAINHHKEFCAIKDLVEGYLPPGESLLWVATKIMEGDEEVTRRVSGYLPPEKWEEIKELLLKHEDSLQAVLSGRYLWIEGIIKRAVSHFRLGEISLTDRLDHYLTRPVLGIPALLVVFSVAFFVASSIGGYFQGILEEFFGTLSVIVSGLLAGAPAWVSGVIVDGAIVGVGLVLTFLPVLAIFFIVLSVFEGVGYMARAAFVLDRFMHLMGLHGKSFMPLCIGLGCNVPAVMGARILETRRERMLTIFLAPFIPCSAKLAITVLLTSALFGENAIFVFPCLLALNFLVIILVGSVANQVFPQREATHFIMELPVYQLPRFRSIMLDVWIRSQHFLLRAGSLIFLSAVLVWVVSYLPHGDLESSYLSQAAKFIEPIGHPLGFDWKMLTGILTSLAAKENAIATMGVLYSAGGMGIEGILTQSMNKANALSFMTVILLMMPCLPTVAVMFRELRSLKVLLANIATMSILAYVAGFVVYRTALFLL
ncbi:MAG: ferrous iron transport protein B [Deltaproteobacteria bacterium]|nr:ferrous iron transport protein B [Deltaproteobacteria bacterium]